MGRPLNNAEFDILQMHADAGDRVAYYTQLEAWGYSYGGLALGVVNNDTISGISANAYFLLNAAEEGVTITADELAGISVELMIRDLDARREFEGSSQGADLPVDRIQAYHSDVFSQAGVSANAWTPNIALDSLANEGEREALWDDLLDNGWFGAAGDAASIVFALDQDTQSVPNPRDFREDAEYIGDLLFSGIVAGDIVALDLLDDPSLYFSILSVSYNLDPQFVTQFLDTGFSISIGNGGGYVFGGGITIDDKGNVTDKDTLIGTANNDVLLGFDGNDILLGGEGNDRLYSGEGSDFINGGVGDDIIGLEDRDGDADIIAVGQGFDWITGQGDAEDRLVLPTELLLAPSEVSDDDEDGPDGSAILFQGTGTALGNGIPILGAVPFFLDSQGRPTSGFSSENDAPLPTAAFPDYSAITQSPDIIIPADPENPEEVPEVIIPGDIQVFSTFSINFIRFEDMLTTNPSVIAHYNSLGYINNPNSLFIVIRYFTNDETSYEPNYVLIENFTSGDFGINLDISPTDGVYTEELINELTNNGDYVPLPDVPDLTEPDLDTGSQPLNNPRILGDRFANLLEGDEGDNTISGRGGDDELIGNEGNDILFAGNGDDILNGGMGADRLNGGNGGDNINGGGGIDTAVYAQSDSGVSVDLELGTGLGGDASGDIILDVENLVGSSFDDSLTGNSEDNRLVGNSGNDALFGGAGNDRLIGGEGSDQLIGGQGTDTAVYTQSDAGVIINLAAGTGVNGDANGDILSEIENVVGSEFNDTLIGDNENNRLVGRNGNDTISGGGGNDRILGGEGDDLLTGGIGNDVFIYGQGFGSDIIFDFEAGIGNADRINLKALNINSFDDVLNSATEENGGVLLSLDEGSIFIEDLTIDQLHQNDFIL